MNIDVTFTESTAEIPVKFQNLQIITNGLPPEEVDKLVTDGEHRGYDAGKQAEYDRFWDAYQDYGNRTGYNIYTGGFAGNCWTDDLFKPKYPIIPTDATMMFRATGITDLTKDGVELDFSNCTAFNYAFAYSKLKKLPTIDMSKAMSTTSVFSDFKGTDLSVIFSETLKTLGNMFSDAKYLANLTIGGTIAASINLQSCPLTATSVQSVIDHLKDLTGQTAQTLTLRAAVGANLTDSQKATITAKNWTLVY